MEAYTSTPTLVVYPSFRITLLFESRLSLSPGFGLVQKKTGDRPLPIHDIAKVFKWKMSVFVTWGGEGSLYPFPYLGPKLIVQYADVQ